MKKYDDSDVNEFLLRQGDNYLPDEIIDNGLLVESYSDIENINCEDDRITGTCLMECRDEGEGMDIDYKAHFFIELDEEGGVENIEFTKLKIK